MGKLTPFKYYYNIMLDVMDSEKSYDTIPNFSAADGVRLLGIGRNQFIDIMNQCRQKTWIWNKKKNIIQKLLPTEAKDFDLEHWWEVRLSSTNEEDRKKVPEEEQRILD